MRLQTIYLVLSLALFITLSPVSGVIGFEVRGPIGNVSAGSNYSLGPKEFSSFFYDMDKDLGREIIDITISEGNKLEENSGIIYVTEAQKTGFEFDKRSAHSWGEYWIIGFLGQKYFAGYVESNDLPEFNSYMAYQSEDSNLLDYEKVSIILNDNNDDFELTENNPLELEEEYELAIVGWVTQNGKIRPLVQLIKDDTLLPDSVDTIKLSDYTYTYKKDLGNAEDVVIIAVHFNYVSNDPPKAMIDGIWQISEKPLEVEVGNDYGQMRIDDVDSDTMKIIMSNKERISINKNDNIPLIGDILGFSFNRDISIKTADQEITTENPLKFYICKEIRESGSYEIRSNIMQTVSGEVSLNATSFPGFYYDLNNGIKTETLRMNITDDMYLEKDSGIIYTTETQIQRLKFDEWGEFKVIGFLGREFFSSYVKGDGNISYLYDESKDTPDLMESGLLSQVLLDYDDNYVKELTIKAGKSLYLMEGYELKIREVDVSGDEVCVELIKDNNIVDTATVQPSISDATMDEKTYTYKKSLTEESDKKSVIIAIHFKNSFLGNNEYATIDGIWQISETPIEITEGIKFGKMVVDESDDERVVMKNKDDRIRLTRKCDSTLMENVGIKTSSQKDIPRRFFLYKRVSLLKIPIADDVEAYIEAPLK